MKKITLIILLSIIWFTNYSQKLVAFRGKVENSYNFWLYIPPHIDTTVNSNFPLVVFLHGSSLCGNDMEKVRRYGVIDAIEMGMKLDAFVLAPQNPGGSWKPDKINALLDWVDSKYGINNDKIYVIGMSLGGYGTLDYAGNNSNRIAAAIALCGGSTLSNLCALNNLPLWIVHGASDRAVSFKQSQRVVDEMKKCGSTDYLIYHNPKGVNHSILARIFYMPEIYNWLFSNSKTDTLKKITAPFEINSKKLTNVYSNFEKSNIKISVSSEQGENYVETIVFSQQYYTIKKGDTLSSIAKKNKTTVATLCKLNKIKESSILQIGKKIKLK